MLQLFFVRRERDALAFVAKAHRDTRAVAQHHRRESCLEHACHQASDVQLLAGRYPGSTNSCGVTAAFFHAVPAVRASDSLSCGAWYKSIAAR